MNIELNTSIQDVVNADPYDPYTLDHNKDLRFTA